MRNTTTLSYWQKHIGSKDQFNSIFIQFKWAALVVKLFVISPETIFNLMNIQNTNRWINTTATMIIDLIASSSKLSAEKKDDSRRKVHFFSSKRVDEQARKFKNFHHKYLPKFSTFSRSSHLLISAPLFAQLWFSFCHHRPNLRLLIFPHLIPDCVHRLVRNDVDRGFCRFWRPDWSHNKSSI